VTKARLHCSLFSLTSLLPCPMPHHYLYLMNFRPPLVPISTLLLVTLLLSCERKQTEATVSQRAERDTIVTSKVITDEIPGAAYRSEAKGYYVVSNTDTSKLMLTLSRTRAHGRVVVDIRYRPDMTYRQQWRELQLIFPHVLRDFDVNLDSLNMVTLHMLVSSGDLAIDIARQYEHIFGEKDRSLTHAKVSAFLMRSKLVRDWNALLKEYSVRVDTVFTEKNFFTEKSTAFYYSQIESDTLNMPDKILDCMLWLRLKRVNSFYSMN
jgi:hypothetical protein